MFESRAILLDIIEREANRAVHTNSSFCPQLDDVFELVLPITSVNSLAHRRPTVSS